MNLSFWQKLFIKFSLYREQKFSELSCRYSWEKVKASKAEALQYSGGFF